MTDGRAYVTDPGPIPVDPGAIPIEQCSIDARVLVYALMRVTKAIELVAGAVDHVNRTLERIEGERADR